MKLWEKVKGQKLVHGIVIVVALVAGTIGHKYFHKEAPIIEDVAEAVLSAEGVNYKFDSDDSVMMKECEEDKG